MHKFIVNSSILDARFIFHDKNFSCKIDGKIAGIPNITQQKIIKLITSIVLTS